MPGPLSRIFVLPAKQEGKKTVGKKRRVEARVLAGIKGRGEGSVIAGMEEVGVVPDLSGFQHSPAAHLQGCTAPKCCHDYLTTTPIIYETIFALSNAIIKRIL